MSKVIFASLIIAFVAMLIVVLQFPLLFPIQTSIGFAIMAGGVALSWKKGIPFTLAGLAVFGLGLSFVVPNVQALGLSFLSLYLRGGAIASLFGSAIFLAWKEEKEGKDE